MSVNSDNAENNQPGNEQGAVGYSDLHRYNLTITSGGSNNDQSSVDHFYEQPTSETAIKNNEQLRKLRIDCAYVHEKFKRDVRDVNIGNNPAPVSVNIPAPVTVDLSNAHSGCKSAAAASASVKSNFVYSVTPNNRSPKLGNLSSRHRSSLVKPSMSAASSYKDKFRIDSDDERNGIESPCVLRSGTGVVSFLTDAVNSPTITEPPHDTLNYFNGVAVCEANTKVDTTSVSHRSRLVCPCSIEELHNSGRSDKTLVYSRCIRCMRCLHRDNVRNRSEFMKQCQSLNSVTTRNNDTIRRIMKTCENERFPPLEGIRGGNSFEFKDDTSSTLGNFRKLTCVPFFIRSCSESPENIPGGRGMRFRRSSSLCFSQNNELQLSSKTKSFDLRSNENLFFRDEGPLDSRCEILRNDGNLEPGRALLNDDDDLTDDSLSVSSDLSGFQASSEHSDSSTMMDVVYPEQYRPTWVDSYVRNPARCVRFVRHVRAGNAAQLYMRALNVSPVPARDNVDIIHDVSRDTSSSVLSDIVPLSDSYSTDASDVKIETIINKHSDQLVRSVLGNVFDNDSVSTLDQNRSEINAESELVIDQFENNNDTIPMMNPSNLSNVINTSCDIPFSDGTHITFHPSSHVSDNSSDDTNESFDGLFASVADHINRRANFMILDSSTLNGSPRGYAGVPCGQYSDFDINLSDIMSSSSSSEGEQPLSDDEQIACPPRIGARTTVIHLPDVVNVSRRPESAEQVSGALVKDQRLLDVRNEEKFERINIEENDPSQCIQELSLPGNEILSSMVGNGGDFEVDATHNKLMQRVAESMFEAVFESSASSSDTEEENSLDITFVKTESALKSEYETTPVHEKFQNKCLQPPTNTKVVRPVNNFDAVDEQPPSPSEDVLIANGSRFLGRSELVPSADTAFRNKIPRRLPHTRSEPLLLASEPTTRRAFRRSSPLRIVCNNNEQNFYLPDLDGEIGFNVCEPKQSPTKHFEPIHSPTLSVDTPIDEDVGQIEDVIPDSLIEADPVVSNVTQHDRDRLSPNEIESQLAQQPYTDVLASLQNNLFMVPDCHRNQCEKWVQTGSVSPVLQRSDADANRANVGFLNLNQSFLHFLPASPDLVHKRSVLSSQSNPCDFNTNLFDLRDVPTLYVEESGRGGQFTTVRSDFPETEDFKYFDVAFNGVHRQKHTSVLTNVKPPTCMYPHHICCPYKREDARNENFSESEYSSVELIKFMLNYPEADMSWLELLRFLEQSEHQCRGADCSDGGCGRCCLKISYNGYLLDLVTACMKNNRTDMLQTDSAGLTNHLSIEDALKNINSLHWNRISREHSSPSGCLGMTSNTISSQQSVNPYEVIMHKFKWLQDSHLKKALRNAIASISPKNEASSADQYEADEERPGNGPLYPDTEMIYQQDLEFDPLRRVTFHNNRGPPHLEIISHCNPSPLQHTVSHQNLIDFSAAQCHTVEGVQSYRPSSPNTDLGSMDQQDFEFDPRHRRKVSQHQYHDDSIQTSQKEHVNTQKQHCTVDQIENKYETRCLLPSSGPGPAYSSIPVPDQPDRYSVHRLAAELEDCVTNRATSDVPITCHLPRALLEDVGRCSTLERTGKHVALISGFTPQEISLNNNLSPCDPAKIQVPSTSEQVTGQTGYIQSGSSPGDDSVPCPRLQTWESSIQTSGNFLVAPAVTVFEKSAQEHVQQPFPSKFHSPVTTTMVGRSSLGEERSKPSVNDRAAQAAYKSRYSEPSFMGATASAPQKDQESLIQSLASKNSAFFYPLLEKVSLITQSPSSTELTWASRNENRPTPRDRPDGSTRRVQEYGYSFDQPYRLSSTSSPGLLDKLCSCHSDVICPSPRTNFYFCES